jgi:KaiC/GvpD/RAD55 family RecA-like ATPase
MNFTGASILADPHPCSHIVYPYTDEDHVREAVCLFASAGLQKDEAVVLIMTKAHCEPIQKRLEAEGFDIATLQDTGQLACIDAEDLLRRFMIGGMPDPVLFKNVVGMIITRAQTKQKRVRLFGEMVSLLWTTSLAAAESLERLWNEVLETYSVALLCTYALDGERPGPIPPSLLALHSHHLATD